MQDLRSLIVQDGIQLPPLAVVVRTPGEDVYGFAIHDASPWGLWTAIRKHTPMTGLYPILIGGYGASTGDLIVPAEGMATDNLIVLGERWGSGAATATGVIAAAISIDTDAWLAARLTAWEEASDDTDGDPQGNLRVLDEWPSGLLPSTEQDLRLADADVLALVPTQRAWEVPAHLLYGGWHSWLTPEDHTAMAKRWYERFGAELVAVGPDSADFIVAHPPEDRMAASALAGEHFLYCHDVAYDDASLTLLAARLLNGRAWRFWWD